MDNYELLKIRLQRLKSEAEKQARFMYPHSRIVESTVRVNPMYMVDVLLESQKGYVKRVTYTVNQLFRSELCG